jgi:ankyrin repeat protein
MTKKDIKIFFTAIRHGDFEAIKALLSNKDYLNVCNFAPPKKDDGQSGLQVAFKTGNFEIAKFLIEQGANVNFMEKSDINEWKAPVLHDCIRATIFTEHFDKALPILRLMLKNGADPNGVDSYGNTCLARGILDFNQIIENPVFSKDDPIKLKKVISNNQKKSEKYRVVFKLLIDAGADIHSSNAERESAIHQIKFYELEEYKLF